MADVHNKVVRSYNMSQIKAKDTKPELLVRKFLFSNGFRYKLHDQSLPGKPDIVLPKFKAIVFVNGCFWHGHKGCKYFVIPKTNREWWETKINRTIENDKKGISVLKRNGWNVITIWECELKKDRIDYTLMNISKRIKENE